MAHDPATPPDSPPTFFSQPVLDALSAQIAIVDASGRVVAVNRAWTRFGTDNGGQEGASGVGADYFSVCRAGNPTLLREMQRVLAGERDEYDYTYPCHAPRERRWFRARVTPVVQTGAVTHLVLAHDNITREKRQESELHKLGAQLESRARERAAELIAGGAYAETLARLGDALQQAESPDEVSERAVTQLAPTLRALAMLIVRARGDALHISYVWGEPPAHLHEYTSAGRPLPALERAPLLARVVESGEGMYLKDYGLELGIPSVLPNSPLACGVAPIRQPGGKLEGFMVCWRDAGPWSEGARDLLHRAATTVGLALERAEAAGKIREANAELLRSNAELERFAYVASHDLQEPIRTITSFADVLERGYGEVLDERGQTYLKLVQRGALRLKVLVDDLLAYSRLNAPRPALRDVPLAEPLGEALARLQAALREAGARVTHENLPTVRGDGAALAQVFQNLIGNALKFRREGVAPEVCVSAARDVGGWRVTVADNGIGMEARYLVRVFEMFERLHAKQQYEGTGLGLAICKKIVERHGGRIWAESAPGVGSAFFFTLPDGRGGDAF